MIDFTYFILLFFFFFPLFSYLALLYILPGDDKRNKKAPYSGSISVILPCYNEEDHIEEKINGLLLECNNSTIEEYEIIIVSDGSTDNTNHILKRFSENKRIKLHYLTDRSGKAFALNLAINKSIYPILVFSDTRYILSKGVFGKLLSHLEDSEIGAISSMLIHKKEISRVRNIINALKKQESVKGSTIGVYGALYVARKQFIDPLPKNTILDDLYISLSILSKGKKVIMDTSARIYELEFDKFYPKERTLRIIYGLFQFIIENFTLYKRIPVKYKIYLFGQKYYKLYAPLILVLMTTVALFSKTIIYWHISIIIISIFTLAIYDWNMFLRITRFTVMYFRNIFILNHYNSSLWKKLKE